MNSIWFVSTAKKNYEKTLQIGSRPQTKTSSPNGRDHSTVTYEKNANGLSLHSNSSKSITALPRHLFLF